MKLQYPEWTYITFLLISFMTWVSVKVSVRTDMEIPGEKVKQLRVGSVAEKSPKGESEWIFHDD